MGNSQGWVRGRDLKLIEKDLIPDYFFNILLKIKTVGNIYYNIVSVTAFLGMR